MSSEDVGIPLNTICSGAQQHWWFPSVYALEAMLHALSGRKFHRERNEDTQLLVYLPPRHCQLSQVNGVALICVFVWSPYDFLNASLLLPPLLGPIEPSHPHRQHQQRIRHHIRLVTSEKNQ